MPSLTSSSQRDPRVIRTRARVLAEARAMLDEVGPAGLNYTALAKRAQVTRQTLYQHWPTVNELMLDLIGQVAAPEPSVPSADARSVLIGFLRGFRDAMRDPATAAMLSALMANAERDSRAASAMKDTMTSQLKGVNGLLEQAGLKITATQLSRLLGPVLFRRFIHRARVTDAFITETVDAFLGTSPPHT